jgi:predicted peroxiredoxin
MKKFFILFLLPALLLSCNMPEDNKQLTNNEADTATSMETVRDGAFIHLSHGAEDPHRVWMAMKMADIMSQDKDVLLYFDITAVNVVLKNAPDISVKEGMSGSQEMLNKLIGNGVQLLVCPGCLEVAGKTKEDVMDGVGIAEKELFFNFTKGRILTIDY